MRGGLLADGTRGDVLIGSDGRVRTADPGSGAGSRSVSDDGLDLDLTGWVVLPSAVEPHAHLDKAFSWAGIAPRYGDLLAAIGSWRAYAATMDSADVRRRARAALLRYLAAGYTAVRTHVDTHPEGDPLRGVRALVELREEFAGVLDLQVCLLSGTLAPTGVLRDAIDAGVDVLGGCPHLAQDPVAETTRLLDLAEQTGLDVDLHTDEQLGADVLWILELARQVRDRGFAGRVAASHCVSLGSLAPRELARVVDAVAAAGMSVVTLPITNLYLQGRESPAPVPRGITAVRALLAAGVNVPAGADNVRDPFNPMGRTDPFETTSLLVTAAHLDADAALRAVTSAGRSALGLPAAGTDPGQVADLVAVRAQDLTDVLAGAGTSRIVLRRGRVVSRTTVESRTVLDTAVPDCVAAPVPRFRTPVPAGPVGEAAPGDPVPDHPVLDRAPTSRRSA